MTDIAKLNIEINSSKARQAKTDLDQLTRSGEKSERQMGTMSKAATKLGAALVAAFASYKLAQFTKEVALAAARYETLGVVLNQVGRNAGLSAKQVNEYAKQVRESGIQMDTARQVTIRMVQAQIDMTKASQLARIAQDAAVIGNINSSEALERMIHGIQSAQPLVLRNIGLNVNFENSYKKLADQLGITTKELSESQKMQARTNVVLEQGARLAGVYEESMDTAGKQISSFIRYVNDFKIEMGQAFNPATAEVVKSMTAAMKELTTAVSSPDVQENLRRLSQGFADWVSSNTDLINQNLPEYIGSFSTAIKNMGLVAEGVFAALTILNEGMENIAINAKAAGMAAGGAMSWGTFLTATTNELKELIIAFDSALEITYHSINKNTEGFDRYSGAAGGAAESTGDLNDELSEIPDHIKKAVESLESLRAQRALDDFFGEIDAYEDLLREKEQMTINAEESLKQIRIQTALDGYFEDADNYDQLQKDKTDAYEKAQREQTRAQEKALAEQEQQWKRAYDDMHKFAADTFYDIFDGQLDSFEDFADQMLNIFKRMLANMAAEAAMTNIFKPLMNQMAGSVLGNLMGLPSSGGMNIPGLSSIGRLFGTSQASSTTGYGATAPGIMDTGTGFGGSSGMGGMAMGAFYTAFAGVSALIVTDIIKSLTSASPSIRIGHHKPGDPSAHTGAGWAYGSKSSMFDYRIGVKDTDQDPQVQQAMFEYFDGLFSSIENSVGVSMQAVLDRHGYFSEGIRLDHGGTINDLSNQIFSELFSSIISEMFLDSDTIMKSVDYQVGSSRGTGGGREGDGFLFTPIFETITRESSILADHFNEQFFQAITPEGGSSWDAFAEFANVVDSTDGFVEEFTRRVDDLGQTAVDAYQQIQLVSQILSAVEMDAAAVNSVSLFNDQLNQSYLMFAQLRLEMEAANATEAEKLELEKLRGQILGAQLTGLNASAISSALSSGSGFGDILLKSVRDMMSRDFANQLMKTYLTPFNEAALAVMEESGLEAYLDFIEDYDFGPATEAYQKFTKAIEDTGDATNKAAAAMVAYTREAELMVAEILQGGLTASQMFEQWGIETAGAAELFASITEGGVTRKELEDSVKAFSDLGLEGDQLNKVIGYLVDSFVSAASRISAAITGIDSAKDGLPTTDNNNRTPSGSLERVFASFLNYPELSDIMTGGARYVETEVFDESKYISLVIAAATAAGEVMFDEGKYIQAALAAAQGKHFQEDGSEWTQSAFIEAVKAAGQTLEQHFLTTGAGLGIDWRDVTSPWTESGFLEAVAAAGQTLEQHFQEVGASFDIAFEDVMKTIEERIEGSGEIVSSQAAIGDALDVLNQFKSADFDIFRDYQQFIDTIDSIDSGVLLDIFGPDAEQMLIDLATAYHAYENEIKNVMDAEDAAADARRRARDAETEAEKNRLNQIANILERVQTDLDTMDMTDLEKTIYNIERQVRNWILSLEDLSAAENELALVREWGIKQTGQAHSAEIKRIEAEVDRTRNEYIGYLQKEIELRRNAFNEARSALEEYISNEERLIDARKRAADSIEAFINGLMISTRVPVQSLEFFEKRYEQLLHEAQTASPEDLSQAVSNLTGFTGEYLDFAGAYGGGNYKDLFDRVVGDLEGLQAALGDPHDQLEELQWIRDLIGSTDGTLKSLEEMVSQYIAAEDALDEIAWMSAELDLLRSIDTNMALLLAAQEAYYNAVENAKPNLIDEIKKHADYLGDGMYSFHHPSIDVLGEAAIGQQPAMIARMLGLNPDDYSFAGGGISYGPDSGYPITSHGIEAHVPIQNGSIPVQIQGDFGRGDIKVIVKIGERELQDIQVDVLENNAEAHKQIRRVANG